MGKHEPMSAKAIAIRIKAKGLQKINYYCQMCEKQCRDANGFKCHIESESHQRQALIVAENPKRFVDKFSQQFMDGFLYLLKTRYRSSKVLANTVFQEYIKERDHIHMNATKWTSLTEFAQSMDQEGIVHAEESERGIMVTYIDNDPEKKKREELKAQSDERAKQAEIRKKLEIEKQIEAARQISRDRDAEGDNKVEDIPNIKKKVNNYKPPPPKKKVRRA